MTRMHRLVSHDEDREGADRQTASLAGLAVTLLVVVACLFLMRALHDKSAVEDCLLSGRSNCDVALSSSHWNSYRQDRH